jgi:hypothetical protein
MLDSTMTPGLTQTWVPQTDARGRTHLEARWVPSPSNAAPIEQVPTVVPTGRTAAHAPLHAA